MSTKSKLLAMTGDLQLPEDKLAQALVEAAPEPTSAERPATKFPPVVPGAAARTGPGQMANARTPVPRNSRCRPRTSRISNALVAAYVDIYGMACDAAADDMTTRSPLPRDTIAGSTCDARSTTATQLRRTSRTSVSRSRSTNRPCVPIPAFSTATSMGERS